MDSPVPEHAIKVRKPYTITKQRERWTEEEHKKFLEALKLYDRAWRQIEEHVGSKTAVQIRSHAQKFFTKAVRESKTIEIPPPRPKKRPTHPYPRKLSNLPSIQVREDNESPSSVLSSSCDQMNSGTSPVSSSVGGSDPVGTLPCEQENGCHSVDDEDVTLPIKIDSSVEAPLASLKLFGKTVVVADPQNPPCVTDGVLNVEMGEGSRQWNPWVSAAPMVYLLNSGEASVVPVPWVWAFSGEHQSSVAGSNSIEGDYGEMLVKVRRSKTSAFRSLKATTTPKKETKGFVPYKRWVAGREGETDHRDCNRI